LITHSFFTVGGLTVGWVLGTFMDIFRQPLARYIGRSRIGRNPNLNIVPVEETVDDEADYSLTIANTGDESVEELGVFLSFVNEIEDYNVVPYGNEPPYPDMDIELRQDGGVDIRLGGLPETFGDATPVIIDFVLGKEKSSLSDSIREFDSKTSNDIVVYLNGRVRWTFIGEEAYDDSNGVYLPAEPHLP